MLFCEQRWSQTKAPSLAKCSRQLPVSQKAVLCEESIPMWDLRAENSAWHLWQWSWKEQEGHGNESWEREAPVSGQGGCYRRMYWQSTWCFFLGVPFWLWNICVCVHSYTCLYFHIHSHLWKCVLVFSRAKNCIAFLFFLIEFDFFICYLYVIPLQLICAFMYLIPCGNCQI